MYFSNIQTNSPLVVVVMSCYFIEKFPNEQLLECYGGAFRPFCAASIDGDQAVQN